MRFGATGSRSASARDEFLKVFGDFGEQLSGNTSAHAHDACEHAGQEATKMSEGDGAIDPPR